MEWIQGPSIRQWLEQHNEEIELVTQVMRLIGASIGGLHAANVYHGDLTTSNLILRETAGKLEVVLIDFGLGSVSTSEEDMAVDLYVLERAFASTHPKSEGLVSSCLKSVLRLSMLKFLTLMPKHFQDRRLS